MVAAKLIVNRTGQLSACPTREQFERDQFVTQDMIVFDIEASQVVLHLVNLSGQTAWFVGEGLPDPKPQPGRVYLVVYAGRLWPLKKVV